MSYYNDYEYDDESVTLEEAMDFIDDYLTEKGAFGKYLDKREAEIIKIEKEMHDIERRLKTTDGPTKKRLQDLLRKKIIAHDKMVDAGIPGVPSARIGNILDIRHDATMYRGGDTEDRKYLKNRKEKFNQATGGPRREKDTDRPTGDRGRQTIPESLKRANAQKKAKNQTTQESVNDLRLQVFEAYESGAISEDEKYTFLDYLNLDNYE